MKRLTFVLLTLLVSGFGTMHAQNLINSQFVAAQLAKPQIAKAKGRFALATIERVLDSCAPMDILVEAADQMIDKDGTIVNNGAQSIFLSEQRFNSCTGTLEFSANGYAVPDSLTWRKNGAAATAQVQLKDQNGVVVTIVTVNLNWTANTQFSDSWTDNTSYGDLGLSAKFSGTINSADLTGSILDGPIDWVQNSTVNAFIGTSSGMTKSR